MIENTNSEPQNQSEAQSTPQSQQPEAAAAQPVQAASEQPLPTPEPQPAAAPQPEAAPQAQPAPQPAAGEAVPAPATQPMATPVAAPAAKPAQQPMGQPMPAPAPQPSPTSALVCGILAIVFCFIPVVGIVLGIVAIVLAGKYFKAGGTLGQGKAGRICGIVGIVLSIVMIVVNCILVFRALTVLDDYGSGSTYISTGTEQSQRSTPPAATLDETEEAVAAAANAKLDLLKQKDPATVQALQAMAEATFTDSFDNLEKGITMEDCGIVPSAYIDMLLTGFDYETSSVFADTEATGAEGRASYDITCKSLSEAINTALDTLTEDDAFYTLPLDEQKLRLGTIIMESIEAAPVVDDEYMSLDLTYDGTAWVVDPESWDDEMEYYFGF